MTLENEYLTHDDKPYTENFNSSKLVSDIFDLTIPLIYPDNCKTATWGQVGSVKKCHVGIVEIKEASSGLDINTGDVSGTGTLKVRFYPNFDTFDKITRIDWLYDIGTVTCDLYTQTGQLIQENIPNGAQTSASAELNKLQNFELRFNLTNANLNSFRVVMKNTKKSPTNGKIGISDVNNLQTALDGKASNTNDTAWTDLSSYVNTNAFSVTTCKGMIRNGFAIINLFLIFKTVSSSSPRVLRVYDLKFKPKGNLLYLPVTANYTQNVVEACAIEMYYNGFNYFDCNLEVNNDNIIVNASKLHGLLIYPIDDY